MSLGTFMQEKGVGSGAKGVSKFCQHRVTLFMVDPLVVVVLKTFTVIGNFLY